MSAATNPGNFANRPTEEVKEIAAKGGHASHGHQEPAPEDLPGNGNPGNFANRPKEEVREIAAMGGKASHGPHHEEVSFLSSSGMSSTKSYDMYDGCCRLRDLRFKVERRPAVLIARP